jgi:hypothetical protein
MLYYSCRQMSCTSYLRWIVWNVVVAIAVDVVVVVVVVVDYSSLSVELSIQIA